MSDSPIDSPFNDVGMPPINLLDTSRANGLRDTQRGNPIGDRVDNSQGVNNVDGRSGGNPIRPTRGQGAGAYLGMYSKPSWLYH